MYAALAFFPQAQDIARTFHQKAVRFSVFHRFFPPGEDARGSMIREEALQTDESGFAEPLLFN